MFTKIRFLIYCVPQRSYYGSTVILFWNTRPRFHDDKMTKTLDIYFFFKSGLVSGLKPDPGHCILNEGIFLKFYWINIFDDQLVQVSS